VPAASLFTHIDGEIVEFVQGLRFQPLTWCMVLLSAWWVKGLVIGGLAAVADLRRRAVPWTFLWATVAGLLAWRLSSLVKDAVDRPRPFADGEIHAVGRLPGGSSFPSGHAATAFAAATVVAILAPRLRVPALVLAALIAFSRVYLGVHFLSDVLAGAVLGIGVGLLVSAVGPTLARWASARRATGRSAPMRSGAGPNVPPASSGLRSTSSARRSSSLPGSL